MQRRRERVRHRVQRVRVGRAQPVAVGNKRCALRRGGVRVRAGVRVRVRVRVRVAVGNKRGALRRGGVRVRVRVRGATRGSEGSSHIEHIGITG